MRGMSDLVQPTNWGTVYLYNNSTGRDVLVVRAFNYFASVSTAIFLKYYQGFTGTAGGVAQVMVPGDGQLPGVWYGDDIASQGSNFDYSISYFSVGWEPNETPHFVLPPGWSVMAQGSNDGSTIQCWALWEAIRADELDYPW